MFLYYNVPRTRVIRVFEAFAGIGAQRKALELENINYKIVGMAEWYVPAIVSYQAIHNGFTKKTYSHKVKLNKMVDYLEDKPLSINSKTPVVKGYWKRKHLDEIRIVYNAVKMSEDEGNIFDVRRLYKRTLKGIDLLTYSFPCQDLSQQGSQKGMSKKSGSRSGLLWEIEKALESTNKKELPKFLLMENVVALTHQKNQKDLKMWMEKLDSLGYKNDLQILNAGDFGSSQARRRAFMISSLKEEVKLPVGNKKPKAIRSILDRVKEKNYMPALDDYDLSPLRPTTKSNIKKRSLINYSTFNSESYVYDQRYTGPTLTASGANSRIKILHEGRIRKLNAREAYKYMGFSGEDFDKVNDLNYLTETKMIFTAGNSISIEVLRKIMESIAKGVK